MCGSQQNIADVLALKFPQSPRGAESQSLGGKNQEIIPTLKVFRGSAKEVILAAAYLLR